MHDDSNWLSTQGYLIPPEAVKVPSSLNAKKLTKTLDRPIQRWRKF
jgi:hypothetical protein